MRDREEPMNTATVALLQLRIDADEPVSERVPRALAWAREAAGLADVVVLPELWHVGAFDIDCARANAEPIDGPLIAALAGVASETGTWLHAGSFTEITSEGEHFNTSVVIAPDGSIAALYRKIHLFGFTGGETTLMSAGREVVTVETPLGTTGIATCYDLRFPELYRRLTEHGATAVVMASGWPSRRIDHWSTLVRARAIENQCVMAACNEVGTHGGTELGGRSVIVDAQGRVLAEGGSGEELVIADIDVEAASRWRAEFPVLGDRVL